MVATEDCQKAGQKRSLMSNPSVNTESESRRDTLWIKCHKADRILRSSSVNTEL